MSISQEASKNIGNMCCGPWTHQRNPARKRRIGILLVTIGLIWLGARVGLLDFSWLQAIHFWPVVFILLGVWMVHKGFMQGKSRTIDNKRRRFEMEAMFGKMMEECMKGMSEEEKKKMMVCGEKMAAIFSSTGMKDMTEEGKKAIREKMMACCGARWNRCRPVSRRQVQHPIRHVVWKKRKSRICVVQVTGYDDRS